MFTHGQAVWVVHSAHLTFRSFNFLTFLIVWNQIQSFFEHEMTLVIPTRLLLQAVAHLFQPLNVLRSVLIGCRRWGASLIGCCILNLTNGSTRWVDNWRVFYFVATVALSLADLLSLVAVDKMVFFKMVWGLFSCCLPVIVLVVEAPGFLRCTGKSKI